jgi:hypothetical protein
VVGAAPVSEKRVGLKRQRMWAMGIVVASPGSISCPGWRFGGPELAL